MLVKGPPKEVNWMGSVPSLSQIQISLLPERFDSNVILLPSGEKLGNNSDRVEEMNLFGVAASWEELVTSTRQML